MEHQRYIARKRARFVACDGRPVNIPYGTPLQLEGDFLCLDGRRLCFATSQNGVDYFVQDGDGQGRERGELVNAILARLKEPGVWQAIWDDPVCQRYKRTEHEDHWIWHRSFYDAPVQDLCHIARSVYTKKKARTQR